MRNEISGPVPRSSSDPLQIFEEAALLKCLANARASPLSTGRSTRYGHVGVAIGYGMNAWTGVHVAVQQADTEQQASLPLKLAAAYGLQCSQRLRIGSGVWRAFVVCVITVLPSTSVLETSSNVADGVSSPFMAIERAGSRAPVE